jgi:hypothetical protein
MANQERTNAGLTANIFFSQQVFSNDCGDAGGLNQPVGYTEEDLSHSISLTSNQINKAFKYTTAIEGSATTGWNLSRGTPRNKFGNNFLITKFGSVNAIAITHNGASGELGYSISSSSHESPIATGIITGGGSVMHTWPEGVAATGITIKSLNYTTNTTVMGMGSGYWVTGEGF